jgi:hypothetical protein
MARRGWRRRWWCARVACAGAPARARSPERCGWWPGADPPDAPEDSTPPSGLRDQSVSCEFSVGWAIRDTERSAIRLAGYPTPRELAQPGRHRTRHPPARSTPRPA